MKIFGCLLILISSVSCAYFYEKSLKNKILILGEIIEFIKKYKIQLDIYKEAIEKLTGYRVEKKYIYSFNLDRKIEVK